MTIEEVRQLGVEETKYGIDDVLHLFSGWDLWVYVAYSVAFIIFIFSHFYLGKKRDKEEKTMYKLVSILFPSTAIILFFSFIVGIVNLADDFTESKEEGIDTWTEEVVNPYIKSIEEKRAIAYIDLLGEKSIFGKEIKVQVGFYDKDGLLINISEDALIYSDLDKDEDPYLIYSYLE